MCHKGRLHCISAGSTQMPILNPTHSALVHYVSNAEFGINLNEYITPCIYEVLLLFCGRIKMSRIPMEKDDIKDEIIDLISGILPYGDVKRLNDTITDGLNYSKIKKEIEDSYVLDENLKREIQLRKDIKRAVEEMEETEELREQLDEILRGKNRWVYKYKKLGMAATISILIIAGVLSNFITPKIDPDKIYSSNYEKYHLTGSKRVNSDLFKIAKEKYIQGSLEEAKLIFENVKGPDGTEPERLLYKGLTYMELNDFKGAIYSFEILKKKYPESKWADYSKWYLALSYIKTREIEKAEKILNYIVENKTFNSEKAETILKELSLPFSIKKKK